MARRPVKKSSGRRESGDTVAESASEPSDPVLSHGKPKKARGAPPGVWMDGLAKADLAAYQEAHKLNKAQFAAYLGASVGAVTSWLKGGAPRAEKQLLIKELISKDYVAPQNPKAKRGRPRAAHSADVTDVDVPAAASHTQAGGGLAAAVAAYLSLLHPGRMTADELDERIARFIKRLSPSARG